MYVLCFHLFGVVGVAVGEERVASYVYYRFFFVVVALLFLFVGVHLWLYF